MIEYRFSKYRILKLRIIKYKSTVGKLIRISSITENIADRLEGYVFLDIKVL